jgi:MCP family monocarboxylic acid transporter-like MFS transporter 14
MKVCFVFLSFVYTEYIPFCFVGWIYDITQKYDFSFYICGLLYMVGIFFLLLHPCIRIIEQSRRKHTDGAHV